MRSAVQLGFGWLALMFVLVVGCQKVQDERTMTLQLLLPPTGC